MMSRWLTLLSALALAVTLGGTAVAKPPDERLADRAEKAAERAAKAAERASDAAERAERDRERDRGDRGRKDRPDRRDSGELDLASVDDGGRVLEPALSDRSGKGDGGDGSDGSGDSDGGDSGSSSGSNSGPGSGDDDDRDDDHSGHGSGGDGDDDGDDDHHGGHDDGGGRSIVPTEKDGAGYAYREGELVIMSDDAGLLARAEALGFGVIEARQLESIGSVVARLRRPAGISSSDALEMLRTREPESPAGYNYIYQTAGKAPVPADDASPEEEAPREQPVTGTGKGRRIGVIDGFASDAVAGWTVEKLTTQPAQAGHGDVVTTILLRDLANAYAAQPDTLMLLDVMSPHPTGGAADVAALVFAFDRLVTDGADIVNLSLAGPDHPALRHAVRQSQRAGLIIVAAVGNEGPAAAPAFPAAYDGVIGVAAVDSAGKPYIYSGRGPHVDIAALGVEIVTSGGSTGERMGTSYAAPHVTAMIAGERGRTQGASVDVILAQYAEDAGAPGRDPVYGLGILTFDRPSRVALASDGK